MALTKVVVRGLPFHCTTDVETKLVPLTVRVKAGPPWNALLGAREGPHEWPAAANAITGRAHRRSGGSDLLLRYWSGARVIDEPIRKKVVRSPGRHER